MRNRILIHAALGFVAVQMFKFGVVMALDLYDSIRLYKLKEKTTKQMRENLEYDLNDISHRAYHDAVDQGQLHKFRDQHPEMYRRAMYVKEQLQAA
jgi:hypothetical protein